MKLHIYLDTSVLSALFDDRAPERRRDTEQFWARLGEFEASASDLTRNELSRTPDARAREQLLRRLGDVSVFPMTQDMQELADRYVAAGLFSPIMRSDALHVAAAILTRHDVLVSWNFRHLVNRRRRAKINEVNISLGLPVIDIVAPPEV